MTVPVAVAVVPEPAAPRPMPVIAGRCMTDKGEEMACTFEDVTLTEMRLCGAAPLRKGGVVICFLAEVGIIPARVMGPSPAGGWIVRPIVVEERRPQVRDRLAWHADRAQEQAEQRAAPRIVPRNRRVVVSLGERLSFRGTIQNVSTTGAAIALNLACAPFAGSPVRVGRREATVVRVTPDGIAVQFRAPIPAASFGADIVL